MTLICYMFITVALSNKKIKNLNSVSKIVIIFISCKNASDLAGQISLHFCKPRK